MRSPVLRPAVQRPCRTTSAWLVTFVPLTMTLGMLASCASLSGEAGNEFARTASCPPDRVTVLSRVGPGFVPEESPPPDVAADPERLAFWRQQQEARTQAMFGGCEWFEASGCGQREILCCEHPTGDHGEVFTSSAVCTPKSASVPNRERGTPIGLPSAPTAR